MLDTLLAKVVGTQNERELKRLRWLPPAVQELEPALEALSDEQLRGKTAELRARVKPAVDRLDAEEAASPRNEGRIKDALTNLQDALDELLPEAFAVVREAARRTLNMRHYDVQ